MKHSKAIAAGAAVAVLSIAAAAWAGKYSFFTAKRVDDRYEGHTYDSRLASGALMLTGFSALFPEANDHKVAEVGVWPIKDKLHGTLRDSDGKERFVASAHYAKRSGDARPGLHTNFPVCKGTCRVKIAKRPGPGWRFVLQGFRFKRTHTGDSNIERIAIRLHSDTEVKVTFKDNKTFPFETDIYYQWFPAKEFTKYSTATGRRFPGQRVAKVETGAPRVVIEGFDVRFENGDHHLRDFGMFQPGAPYKHIEVRLTDRNDDDPVFATIDYAVLKNP
jgi:hypothetical protein